MGRKLGAKGKPPRYGRAVLVVRWPYLAFENLEVTVEYMGKKMLLQVQQVDVLPGNETIKGNDTIQ